MTKMCPCIRNSQTTQSFFLCFVKWMKVIIKYTVRFSCLLVSWSNIYSSKLCLFQSVSCKAACGQIIFTLTHWDFGIFCYKDLQFCLQKKGRLYKTIQKIVQVSVQRNCIDTGAGKSQTILSLARVCKQDTYLTLVKPGDSRAPTFIIVKSVYVNYKWHRQ